ncbi:hypothetical protein D1007_45604 [Hordeum vulgare]|nr:hypothetical protein D1007_45604 [Hordeum vulgare]
MEASMSSLSSSVLLLDVLLEISAHSDPVTLVRCAATCKVLRREIANPAFHRRLRLRRADRFVPMFFRGFFVQNQHKKVIQPPRFSVPVRPSEPSPEPFRSFLLDNDSMLEFYHLELAASRGLVSLRSNTPDDDGDGACHYRQLAAELASGRLKTQEFSPVEDNSRWQAIAETVVAPCPQDAALLHPPLVLQGDTHWLCRSTEYHFILRFSRALLQATVTKIDGSCGEQLRGRRQGELLLVSDGQGRQPQLLVAIGLQISVWKLSDSGGGNGWSMQVLVEPERVHQNNVLSESLELRWFGEKSGYVFVRMAGANESSLSWLSAGKSSCISSEDESGQRCPLTTLDLLVHGEVAPHLRVVGADDSLVTEWRADRNTRCIMVHDHHQDDVDNFVEPLPRNRAVSPGKEGDELMYVDHLDLSTLDIDVLGGPPSPHKFVFSMWAYSFVGEHTHRPTGCRGRYDYNSSHELPKTQEELFGDGYGGMDAGPAKDDHDDTENVQHGSGRMKSREAPAGECNRKAPDVVPPLKGGNVSTFASDAVVSPSKRGRTTKDGA